MRIGSTFLFGNRSPKWRRSDFSRRTIIGSRPRDLDPIMVRRLKSDLRHFGERFPKRNVDPIRISGLPEEAPELLLSRKLAAYGEVVRTRAAGLSPREAGQARLSLVGLQQRLLSSC